MNSTTVAAYLARIGYSGAVTPTLEVLRAVHRAHLLAVPFENLDISRGRKITIDQDAFVRKIVEERRGGFCYELNGAFASLLQALGFQVTLLSARVSRGDGTFSPEFDHLTLRVDLEDAWLADVGFGECFLEPLRLQPGLEQRDGSHVYRFTRGANFLRLDWRESAGPWAGVYGFTIQPRSLKDFAAMCQFHQTSPESHFTQKRICSRATPDGRITLSDTKLIITRNGEKEERLLSSEGEWLQALREHFGILL